MDPTFPALGIVAVLTGVLMQVVVKPLLELWLPPAAPAHDNLLRGLALVLGVALTMVDLLVGHAGPTDGNGWLLLVGSGATSGLTAVGAYHLLTGAPDPADPKALTARDWTAADFAAALADTLPPAFARALAEALPPRMVVQPGPVVGAPVAVPAASVAQTGATPAARD